jgi:hypothetical protein
VRPEDYFLELVIFTGEEDKVVEHSEDTLRGNEGFNQGLEVFASGLILPVEKVFVGEAPGSAVIVMHQVGNAKYMHQSQEFGTFMVVTTDLVEGIGNAFKLGGSLCLDEDDRDTIYKKNDIGTDGVDAIGEGELVGDMKGIAVDIVHIQEVDIALSALSFDEDCLKATQIFPGVEIAFDGGRDADELFGDLFGFEVVNGARVQCLEPFDEGIPEDGAGLATAQAEGIIG